MASGICGAASSLSQRDPCRFRAMRSLDVTKNSQEMAGVLMMEITNKILTFRGIIDLPPRDCSGPMDELVMENVEDFHKLYPNVVPCTLTSEMKESSIYQGLALLYNALKSIEDVWATNHNWGNDFDSDTVDNFNGLTLEQLGGRVLEKLDYLIKIENKIFDKLEEKDGNGTLPAREKQSNNTDSSQKIPIYDANRMPEARITTVITPLPPPPPPNLAANAPTPPLQPLLNVTPAAPPPPPLVPSKGSIPAPPPIMSQTKGAAPPPPPFGVAQSLRPKRANIKLKRSTHMGNLYRVLKGKVEGTSLNGKKTQGRKTGGLASAGGAQGMADALAEITKRSAYFQQIEEDVQKHAQSIMEIKSAISTFETKDMTELIQFHKYVEQQLEKLTDESQVLARFEGFPVKKLESLRMAVALYSKLEGIASTLKSWKVEPPLGKLLDKVEGYFNKIKSDVDALERTKDEESKRFQSQKIHFDFGILVRIKESLVDVSSNCMELALKERREAKETTNAEIGSKTKACVKMLWRAFQLAFRVYTFAGGQDDRADMLTKQLAHEIETDPQHK